MSRRSKLIIACLILLPLVRAPEYAVELVVVGALIFILFELLLIRLKEKKQPVIKKITADDDDQEPVEPLVVNRDTPPNRNTKKVRQALWHKYLRGDIDLSDLVKEYSKMGVILVQVNATDDEQSFEAQLKVRGKEEWVR